MSTAGAVRHVASFYPTDVKLVVDLARFVGEGLRRGEPAVLIATPRHLDGLIHALDADGLPVAALLRDRMITTLDAADTLSELLVGGVPDHERFHSVIAPVLAAAAGRGPRVRAFGEMVDLLWQAGDISGTLALEGLWNEALSDDRLVLWCAYRASSLAESELADVASVCAHHSDVVAPPALTQTSTQAGAAEQTERAQLFLPTPVAPRAVRSFVKDTLTSWGLGGLVHDATLVASELASNALLHASSPFRVFVRRSKEGDVTVAFHDTSGNVPRRRPHHEAALNGRGVAIVDTLACHWGTDLRPDGGKVVWATLAAPTSAAEVSAEPS